MKRINKYILSVTAAAWILCGITESPVQSWFSDDNGLMKIIGIAHAGEKDLRAGMTDPKTGKKIKYWVAPMDPAYIREEPGKSPMGMDLVPVYEEAGDEKEPASTIRIDPVTVQNMGVRLEKIKRKKAEKTIRAFGNITFDETGIYTVNTKFNGWIEKLHVNFIGEIVKKGQPLFDIYSPELVTAQEEYLLARKNYKQMAQSGYPDISEGARRLVEASRTRLSYWDISSKQIMSLEKTGSVSKLITVHSPADGVVIKKNAFQGHYVKAGEHQYEIADLSTVWVDVDIYEYELPWIKSGLDAEMELAYIPGRKFRGRVLYIYPFLNARTRTARVRLEFANPGHELKPDMYANIYLKSELEEKPLVVPQEAVIDSGIRKIVFVAKGKGHFQPQEIITGLELDGNAFQVLEGLEEGDVVVVSGQFMLDSESRLREAIRKMLEIRQSGNEDSETTPDDDLDMTDMTMDDDMDMSDLTMD